MILHLHSCLNKKNPYLTRDEYIRTFDYPLTNVDYFVFEIANVIGESIKNYFEPNIIHELLIDISKKCKTHLHLCIKQTSYLLNKTSCCQNINFEEEFGMPQDLLPIVFRYNKNIGYFYMKLISLICADINDFLDDYLEPQSAYDVTTDTYMDLLYFVSDNCVENCGNFCILHSNENSYCAFCSIEKSKKLPCPLKKEVSFKRIVATKNDMYHCL